MNMMMENTMYMNMTIVNIMNMNILCMNKIIEYITDMNNTMEGIMNLMIEHIIHEYPLHEQSLFRTTQQLLQIIHADHLNVNKNEWF